MLDHELLDSGDGFKLERFGAIRLIRPESSATWQPKNPVKSWQADSVCESTGRGRYHWQPNLEPWVISHQNLKFTLRLSASKNIGIFPEQEANWRWLSEHIKPGMKILNLFAYTGVATLICAQAGAEVCHVDASKAAVRWASENARLSGLEQAPIRWICDDARAFLKREQKRGKLYDGILLDPPPFGRADSSQFVFKKHILELLEACQAVLDSQPKLFLLNSYAMNLGHSSLNKLVQPFFPGQKVETGYLSIGELKLSSYARFADS